MCLEIYFSKIKNVKNHISSSSLSSSFFKWNNAIAVIEGIIT